MKFEEVLPAMREGTIAKLYDSGERYRIGGGVLEVYDTTRQVWRAASVAFVDGWTLEPEPKVEWPKGSLPWACAKAMEGATGKGGGNYFPRVRRSSNPSVSFCASPMNGSTMRCDWFVALDWEPCE